MNDKVALNPNQIVQYLKKAPEDFTKKDIIKYIEDNDIKMLNFRYVGGDGKLKLLNFIINNKAYLDKILTAGERVDGSSLFSYIEASSSDLYVVPRYRTAYVNPFSEVPAIDILCSYYTRDGKPLESSPEYVLKKAHDALKETTGYSLEALGELEYYVYSELDKIYEITPQKGYHESHPFSKWEFLRLECMETLSQMGCQIKYGHSEVGNIISGEKEYVQHEIEFLPVPVEDAADQLVIAKWAIREIAYKYGLEVSFAPKIIVGQAGSGLHIHSRLVKDIIKYNPETVETSHVLLEAMEKLQQNHLYRIPVVSRRGIYRGMISLFDQTFRFFRSVKTTDPDSDSLLSRRIYTSINLASRTLKAEKLGIFNEEKLEGLLVYVAAMSLSAFREHVAAHDPKSLVIVVGDREDIQFMAVELRIRLLIVTGSARISETVIELAKRNGISILRTCFDSATTVRRLKFSTPVDQVMQEKVPKFRSKDKISEIKHIVLKSPEDVFPVINAKGELKGTIQKNNLEIDDSIQLILVDHNNYDQAVDGASELPLVEILDHHHLDMPVTSTPVTVLNDTVGSTCTLVAEKFKLADLTPSKSIAGILAGGILSDTLMLKSPTTTQRDKLCIKWLEKISETSINVFEKEIFKAGSLIANMSPEKVLNEDKKNYNTSGYNISIAQVEEFSFKEFNENFEVILETLKKIRIDEKLDLFALLVTNVEKQDSLLLVDGVNQLIDILPFTRINKYVFDLPGILSRKKQLIPELIKVISEQ